MVNTIGGVFSGLCAEICGGKKSVDGEICIGILAGELSDDLDLGVKIFTEEVLIVNGNEEGFDNEDLCVCAGLDSFKNGAVIFFKGFCRQPAAVCGVMPCSSLYLC